MSLLARWTIGDVSKDGQDCLAHSVRTFRQHHEAECVVCHNCSPDQLRLDLSSVRLVDQRSLQHEGPKPKGVAWKLYPPRLDDSRHEVVIDNDIVFSAPIPQIEAFVRNDSTLLLEGEGRTYGRFAQHVPADLEINSGIYGMPPGFDLRRFVMFYGGKEWEKNALHEHDASETFDEQGLVALALGSYSRRQIIPSTVVTACHYQLTPGAGMHFMGLNRRRFHAPYRLWKSGLAKLYL